MVGSAVWRALQKRGDTNLLGRTSAKLDLKNQEAVKDFYAAENLEVGIELEYKGKGVDEKAYVTACNHKDYQVEIGKEVLSVDPAYFRPTEVDLLIGDPSKAKHKLGWVPEHDLASLVKDMMEGDISLMKKDVVLLKAGHKILKQAE